MHIAQEETINKPKPKPGIWKYEVYITAFHISAWSYSFGTWNIPVMYMGFIGRALYNGASTT